MKKTVFKILCLTFSLLFAVLCFTGCGSKTVQSATSPAGTNSEIEADADLQTSGAYISRYDGTHPQVVFTMENGETFTMELYPEYAPRSVDNFVSLVKEGFYDGLTFHRVIDNFMAQGGMSQTADVPSIYGEFASNGFSQNTLKHTRGVVSMARTDYPDSASSQFFICYNDCPWLDGSYAAFGKVTEGMETVDAFLEIERTGSENSEPVTPIVIESAKLVEG
ncbi:MAG: peptidylprolyl isomerase [Clostridia bacterium]|nr:peptidylprolyl isomerase [Clostridia bacterium]